MPHKPTDAAYSQALLRGVLDSATSGIVAAEAVRDDEGRIVDFRFTLANPMSERMLFHSAEAIVGNTLLTLFPGNIESGLFEQYARVTETGVPIEVERYYRDERLEFWLNVSAVKVGDGVAITFTDISERKRAEADISERNRQLASQKAFAERIIENVTTGICYLDRDLIYRAANLVYCRFLQMDREQILDRYLFDVVPGGEDTILPIFRAALDEGKSHLVTALPFEYYTATGEKRLTYWDASYMPLVEQATGEVEGVLVLANEVSDRLEKERLQAERIVMLEQTDKMKDQFLSILSHELRTPINAIMGFGSILEDELAGPLNEDQRRYARHIVGGSETLLALINDLLDMSRIQAGKFALDSQCVHPGTIAREVVEHLTLLAESKEQTLSLHLAEPLPSLEGDPQRLSQVLVNLIANAIKFTPEAGAIAVEVRQENDHVRFEVVDNGIGIAEADIRRLFKPFSQLETGNVRSASGTGLGLSIAKALVEAHGGSIGVSAVLGEGSRFWALVPLDPTAALHAAH